VSIIESKILSSIGERRDSLEETATDGSREVEVVRLELATSSIGGGGSPESRERSKKNVMLQAKEEDEVEVSF
jgi:hypothetical protein